MSSDYHCPIHHLHADSMGMCPRCYQATQHLKSPELQLREENAKLKEQLAIAQTQIAHMKEVIEGLGKEAVFENCVAIDNKPTVPITCPHCKRQFEFGSD
jgi:hypothetical protein